MRLVIAQMKHETNTFSPVPTPLAKAVVECAGEGVCTSDYSQLQFRRLRRPIYPLDPLDPETRPSV